MDAELLVTGDELVLGSLVDTNSSWLLRRLSQAGAHVRRVVMVGDDAATLVQAMKEASERADVVVVSGGLGPTSDDLTAACAARFAAVALVTHEPTLEGLRARWAKRARPMPDGAAKQALVPDGAAVLENAIGSAPGFRMRVARANFFFFAGVPREFRHLSERHLLPWVESTTQASTATRTLRCIGLTESELDRALDEWAKEVGVRLGLRAVFPESWASLTLEASTRAQAQARLESLVDEARARLGLFCYSSDDRSLAEVVGRFLGDRGETVAVAESCTGGLLGAALTGSPGSSKHFLGGAITYSNDEKTRALGVPKALLDAVGAVSEEVACAMASGVRERTGATFGLSTTGIAGPGGGSANKPVGTVWMGVAGPDGVSAHLLQSPRDDRESIRTQTVAAVLDLLRRRLLLRQSED